MWHHMQFLKTINEQVCTVGMIIVIPLPWWWMSTWSSAKSEVKAVEHNSSAEWCYVASYAIFEDYKWTRVHCQNDHSNPLPWWSMSTWSSAKSEVKAAEHNSSAEWCYVASYVILKTINELVCTVGMIILIPSHDDQWALDHLLCFLKSKKFFISQKHEHQVKHFLALPGSYRAQPAAVYSNHIYRH